MSALLVVIAAPLYAFAAQPVEKVMPDLLPVEIVTIKHADQRYPTVGDYQIDNGRLVIKVSAMADPRYSFLVALHELVEATLVRQRGIAIEAIDAFDMAYEAVRRDGDESEPGDDPRAPYHKEHVFATKIERLMAKELGVDWKIYNSAVEALP